MSEGDTRSKSTKLFTCPNEGCIRVYKRYGSMVNHLSYGKCEFQLERESLLDTAKVMYSKKLWGGELSLKIDNTDGSAPTEVPLSDIHKKEKEGWALTSTKKAKPFSEKQRNFLEEKFMIGETTGRKLDPVTVAKQMRVARDADGQRLFSLEEVLSSTQIKSFFSRRAKSKNSEELISDRDYEAAEHEEALTALRNEVLEEIKPHHPIMYDGYNLCNLVTEQKLTRLTVSNLTEICHSFELEVPTQKGRKRKASFIDAVTKLVSQCSCNE